MSFSLQFNSINPAPLQGNDAIGKTPVQDDHLLDPLTLEKERLKNLQAPKSCESIETFALLNGDSFLARKVESKLTSKSFAVLVGDAFIDKTGYEGQDVSEQTIFWIGCLKNWKNPNYQGPCNPDMKIEVIDDILSNLQDFQKLSRLFNQSSPKTICETISADLETKGQCIIPLNTHQAKNCDGHVFSCVLEQDKEGRLTATILNVGGGSDMHPLVKIDTHVKKSFMFPPIVFNDRHFFKDKPELAEHLIELLCAYAKLEPKNKKGYKITEIYQLFLSLGTKSKLELSDDTAALSQRTGTCPAKAIKAGHRYYFLKKADLPSYKKTIFFGKLESYFNKWSQLRTNPASFSAKDRALVKRSLSQLAKNIEKERNRYPQIIDEKALLTAQGLLELIDEELIKIKKVDKTELKDFSIQGKASYGLKEPKPVEEKQDTVKIKEEFSPKTMNLKCPSPSNILAFLKEVSWDTSLLEQFKASKRIETVETKAIACIEALKMLPIPKLNGEDAYFDAIIEEERFEIIKQISDIVNCVCLYDAHCTGSNTRQQQMFMMHLTALAIQDRLASKNPAMHLDDCSYPIAIDKLHRHNYFLTGSDQVRFKKLQSYFKQNKEDHIIFDIVPDSGDSILLNDEDKVCGDHNESKNGLGGHLGYLDRFFESSFPKKASLYFLLIKGSIPEYRVQIDDNTKTDFNKYSVSIPKEYYLLQHQALGVLRYLAHLQDGQGISPIIHNKGTGLFELSNLSSNWKLSIWKRPTTRDKSHVCDGSNKLSHFLNVSYKKAINQQVPVENEAIINSGDSYTTSSATLMHSVRFEIYKILKENEMRASLMMKFCEDYSSLIEESDIKFLIHYAFLNDTALIEKITQEPSYCDTLRSFFDNMIKKTRWNPTIDSALFWLQTSILVETHIMEVTKVDVPKERIISMLEFAEQQRKSLAAVPENDHYQAASFLTKALIAGVNKESMLTEEFINSYVLFHVYQSGSDVNEQLIFMMKTQFLHHLPKIKETLSQRGDDAIQTVLETLKIDSTVEENSLVIEWPLLSFKNKSGKQITLNFPMIQIDGEILEHGSWPEKMRKHKDINAILNGTFPSVIKMGHKKVIAQDGSFEIALDDDKVLEFKKRFRLCGEDIWLSYVPKSDLDVTDVPQRLIDRSTFWQDPKTSNIWMFNKNDVPFACIMPSKDKKAIIQKVTSQGYQLKDQFLIQLPLDSPVSKHFATIESIKDIYGFGSKDGNIDTLHFPGLNLSFTMEEKKWVYTKNNEYYVTDGEEIAKPLTTAIYLDTKSGKKGMILPFNAIHGEPFGVNAENTVGNKIGEEHFFFELREKSGFWHSPSNLAMLFLIYSLKRHGQHVEAYEYLCQFHPIAAFDEDQVKVLMELLKDNHETQNLSLALKGYLVFCKAQEVGRLGTLKECPQEEKLKKLCVANLDRIVELMGDDLETSRLSYSPTVSELLNINMFKIFHDFDDSSYSSLFTDAVHWRRFVRRHTEPSSFVSLDTSSKTANNLKKIAKDTISHVKTSNGYPQEHDLLNQSLVRRNKGDPDDILQHYLTILGSEKLSETKLSELKLNLHLLLERGLDNKSYLQRLYFALKFPVEYYELVQKKGKSLSTDEEFLKLEGPQTLAKEMLESHITTSSETFQSSLEIGISEEKEVSKEEQGIVQSWSKLKEEFSIPLGSLQLKYFDLLEEEIYPKTNAFSLLPDKKNSSVNLRVSELTCAFEQKVAKTYIASTLKVDLKLSDLSDNLKKMISTHQERMKGLKDSIQSILDSPTTLEIAKLSKDEQQEIYVHRNRILQGKIQAPSFQTHLMPFMLSQNSKALKEVNPFLSDKQIVTLYDLGIQYMLAGSLIDQAQEAFELVNADVTMLQKVSNILGKERHYNPYKYPEMLIYEYATGNMLRNLPDQAKILKTIIKTLFSKDLSPTNSSEILKRLFFEFQAGGGKTKVLSVILAARAMREGKKPVFFSLPALTDISKEDLREALSLVCQKGMLPLSLPLGKQLREKDLENILKLLHTEDVCFVTEPETWHALRLNQQENYLFGIKKESKLIYQIMNYFKEHALFFIDEEHRNVSSLVEANKASGSSLPYPDYAQELIPYAYDLLYGWVDDPIILENGEYLHTTLDLANNKHVAISQSVKQEILHKLAERLCKILKADAALPYLTDKNYSLPNIRDHKINLARGLILEILPFTLAQKDMMDYGPSTNPNDFVFDPYILGDPAGPKFQDPDIAAAITVQGTRQHGLNEHQIKRYLMLMMSKLVHSQECGQENAKRFIAKFEQLNPPKEFPLEKMTIKSLENPLLLMTYSKTLGRNRGVIKTFESEIALKKIKVYPSKLTSTSQELSYGASKVVHTSATLGCREENPYLEKTGLFLLTEDFMADVIHRALLPHNQEMHFVEESTPEAFLEGLLIDGTDFSSVDGIINIGGMCREATSTDWGNAIIAFSEKYSLGYAGAIIAKDERINESIEKRLYIIRPNEAEVLIEGSDVKMALKKLRLSDKRFFKVYPADMTTGMDLSLAENAKMLITIGENVPISSMVQAIMRERLFLQNPINPKTSQGLIWVCSNKIKKMLEENYGEASPNSALLLGVYNQDAQEKEAIKMRAKQDIEMNIRKLVEDINQEAVLKRKTVSFFDSSCEQLRGVFEISMTHEPYLKYGGTVEIVETEKFLKDYANSLVEDIGIELTNYPQVKKRIDDGILEVKQKVPFFETCSHQNFNATMFQHQEAEQETTQRTFQLQRHFETNTADAKAIPEDSLAKEMLRIGAESALELAKDWQANHVYKVDWLSPNLYILPNFKNTITSEKDRNKKRLTELGKPPSYILAIQNKTTKQREYRLVSAADALIYTKQLQDRPHEDSFQTAILFTANGKIHQTDRTIHGLTDVEIKEWQHSDEFRNIVAEVGLLNSKQIEEERQLKLIQEDPQRFKDLKRILSSQIFFNDEAFGQRWANLQSMFKNQI